MILNCVTQPEGEPIIADDVSAQVRVDTSSEAVLVKLMIQAVREKAESILRRALLTQTWELKLDDFPGRDKWKFSGWLDTAIILPLPPLQKVNSIKYIDANGDEQILDPSEYKVVTEAEPAYIVPAIGRSWPVTYEDTFTVTINFDCGYGNTPDDVPAAIRQWMLINVANLYENRETEGIAYRETPFDISTLADSLIASYRMIRL